MIRIRLMVNNTTDPMKIPPIFDRNRTGEASTAATNKIVGNTASQPCFMLTLNREELTELSNTRASSPKTRNVAAETVAQPRRYFGIRFSLNTSIARIMYETTMSTANAATKRTMGLLYFCFRLKPRLASTVREMAEPLGLRLRRRALLPWRSPLPSWDGCFDWLNARTSEIHFDDHDTLIGTIFCSSMLNC